MSRWSIRLRRAASLLLGVHLLQVILLAASAVCDPVATAVSMDAAQSVAVAPAHAHHGHGLVATGVAPAADEGLQQTAPAHHKSQNSSCPMAMACTVTAVMAPVPSIASSVVQVPTLPVVHTASAPLSMRGAPEPPPPRA